MPKECICEIRNIIKTGNAFDLRVSADGLAPLCAPGQFVHIQCAEDMLLRRPISICDVENSELRLVFEVRGKGTKWLSQRKIGEELNLLMPLGHGFDVEKAGERPVVIGGGIGTPPLLFLAKALGKKADAILGFRDQNHMILTADFEKVCSSVQIATDDGSFGYHGFVDALFSEQMKERNYTSVYACGPKPMLKAISKKAEALGCPCFVSLEERMGCGIGACLVCACRVRTPDGEDTYKHVCKDGPVFDSREVVFDD